MKHLPLTNSDKFAIVDDADYPELSKRNWCVLKTSHGGTYVKSTEHRDYDYLHHAIAGKQDGKEVDHRNGNPFDFRRKNLRHATHSQNQMNHEAQSNNTSGFKGVSRRGNSFRAQITHGGTKRHLGSYGSATEAAEAYDKASRRHHGKFGVTNFAESGGKTMGFFQPYLQPGSDDIDPGWAVCNPPSGKRLTASVELLPPEDPTFDDTHRLFRENLSQDHFNNRSRSIYAESMRILREANDPYFERGVPTNDARSSQNYKMNHVKIIDGEHKSLMSVGKINEAMEDDDDVRHLGEHRLMLADPKMTETQRAALLTHMESHMKSYKKKKNLREKGNKDKFKPDTQFKKGFGYMAKPKPATTNDVIPQDDPQSAERKRTAGMISQEAGFNRRMQRFDRANRSRRSL